jgi:hypothetical protein
MEKKKKRLMTRVQLSHKSTSRNIKPNQQCIETIICTKVDYWVQPSMDVSKLYVLEINILNVLVRTIKL